MANTALGTPQGVPASTDFLGSFKPPKSTSQAIEQEGQLIGEMAKATAAEGEAAAQAGVKKAELQAPILKQEAQAQKAALGEFKSAAEQMQDLEFKPTKESLMSMTGIASLTAIIGLMLGKTGGFSGQSAIDSMTGMMKGYQAGKADIFKQEQATFEKNMQAQKANLEKLKGKLDTALKVAATDRQAAESDISVMLAEIDSDFLKAKYNREGLKGLIESVSKLEDAMAKRDKLAQDAKVKAGKTQGDRYGFGDIMAVASNEAAASMRNIMGLPVESSSGIFGGRSTSSLFTAPVDAFANKLTTESVQRYNAEAGKLSFNLSQLMKGGRVVSVTETKIMDDLLKIKEGDTLETAATRLAEARQIAERAMEVKIKSPNTPDELKDVYRENLRTIDQVIPFTVDDINKFVKERDKSITFGDELKTKYSRGAAAPEAPAAPATPTPAAPKKEKARPGEKVYSDASGNRAVLRNGEYVEVE
jgi:hypothetical protein